MPGIEPPVTYAWWVPALGAVLLVTAVALLLWLASRARTVGPDRERTARGRTDWWGAVETLHARFLAGELDLRGLHLALAHLVRGFGTERTGTDLTSMTRGEVAEGFPAAGELLARFEQPSFARDPRTEARESVDRTLEVISRW
ncbi:MAG: hypothetical protein EOL91_03465 [Actinobacteria bacterium]|nr:hypothetical protein [Actinomycetota bacterium]